MRRRRDDEINLGRERRWTRGDDEPRVESATGSDAEREHVQGISRKRERDIQRRVGGVDFRSRGRDRRGSVEDILEEEYGFCRRGVAFVVIREIWGSCEHAWDDGYGVESRIERSSGGRVDGDVFYGGIWETFFVRRVSTIVGFVRRRRVWDSARRL